LKISIFKPLNILYFLIATAFVVLPAVDPTIYNGIFMIFFGIALVALFLPLRYAVNKSVKWRKKNEMDDIIKNEKEVSMVIAKMKEVFKEIRDLCWLLIGLIALAFSIESMHTSYAYNFLLISLWLIFFGLSRLFGKSESIRGKPVFLIAPITTYLCGITGVSYLSYILAIYVPFLKTKPDAIVFLGIINVVLAFVIFAASSAMLFESYRHLLDWRMIMRKRAREKEEEKNIIAAQKKIAEQKGEVEEFNKRFFEWKNKKSLEEKPSKWKMWLFISLGSVTLSIAAFIPIETILENMIIQLILWLGISLLAYIYYNENRVSATDSIIYALSCFSICIWSLALTVFAFKIHFVLAIIAVCLVVFACFIQFGTYGIDAFDEIRRRKLWERFNSSG